MAVLEPGITSRFIILFMIISCNGNEPHCSKFPFEEALLEKMIRMEIKVEQMEKGINEVKQQVENEVVKLQEMEKDLKTVANNIVKASKNALEEIESTQEKLITNVTEIVSEEVNKMKVTASQNEARFVRMSEDLRELQNITIRTLIDAIRVPSVSFVARAERNLAFNQNDRIVFEIVMANENGSYDPVTGKFTAPVDGTYLFSTQLCSSPGDPIEYAYMIDNRLVQRARSYDSTGYACQTSIMIRKLEKGNKVWLENQSGNTLTRTMHKWNLFSGVLVSIFT